MPPRKNPVPAMNRRANRFERHRKKVIAALIIVILLVAELALRVLAGHGIVQYKRYRTSRHPEFWADIDPVFGTWHYPDREFIHKTPCFTVIYRSNSYGARDVERSRSSDAERRIVVLGDSFAEGFGVDVEDRMTTILESETGVEHLNFATSGSFGSIQEWLLYESLASQFDHSDVFLFMLPDNDFMDNDPGRWPDDRYRPYLRKSGGEFEVFYETDFEDRATDEYSWLKTVRHRIYNNVYLVNAVRQTLKRSTSKEKAPIVRCKYDAFDDRDAGVLLYTYDRIADLAGDRRVTIFIIPRLGDVLAVMNGDGDLAATRLLEGYASGRDNVAVCDLLPYFIGYIETTGIDASALFHSCDGHWSPLGNEVAASAVLDYVDDAGP